MTLMVNTNGALNAPTNFFRANTNELSSGMNGSSLTNIGVNGGKLWGTFAVTNGSLTFDGIPGGGGGTWPRSFSLQNFDYIQNLQANHINWYGVKDATIAGGNLYLTTYTNIYFNTPEIASFSLSTNAVPVLTDLVTGQVKFVPLESLQLGTAVTSGKVIGKHTTSKSIVSGTVDVDDVASATTTAAAAAARVRQVASVSAMQALTGLANGDQIITAGRTAAGDGGGAIYYYSSSSAATTNSGAIFTATGMGTGQYLWNNVGDLTVRMFGAVGDGTTDDYTAIMAALNYASTTLFNAGYARKVVIGAGVFAFATTISVPESCQLVGNGPRINGGNGATQLRYTGSNAQAITLNYGAQLRDLYLKSFTYQTSANTASYGIFLGATGTGMTTASGLSTIDNVWITGFATAIGGAGSSYNHYLDRIHVDGFSRQGLSIPAGGTAWKLGAIYVQNLDAATGVTSTGTITAASRAGTVLTLTMSSKPDNLQVGMYPVVSGLSPSGANGVFVVTAISGSGPYTVTLNMPADPGAITVGTGTLTQLAMPCVGPIVDLGYGDIAIQSLDVEWAVVTGTSVAIQNGAASDIGLLYMEQVYNTSTNPNFVNYSFKAGNVGVFQTVNMGQGVGVTGCYLRTVTTGSVTVGNVTGRDMYRSGAGTTMVLARGDTGTIKPIIGQVGMIASVHGGDSTFSSTGGYQPLPVPASGTTVAVDSSGNLSVGGTASVTGALTAPTVNGNAITTGTGTLTLAASKTATVNNTLTLAGTDGTTMTFPSTSATVSGLAIAETYTGVKTFAGSATTPLLITATDGSDIWKWSRGGNLYASAALSAYVEMKAAVAGGSSGWRFQGPSATQGVLSVVPVGNVANTTGDKMTLRSFSYTGADMAVMALSANSGADNLTLGRGQGSSGPQNILFYTTATQATGSPVLRGTLDYTGGWEIGGGSASATALMTINSTTKGFLPPRMTTAQKAAISSPTEGMMVYDSTLHKLCVYTGAAWETVTSVTPPIP